MTYIIVDFEATCCDKGSVARDEMEIIEIGAVALEGNGPKVLDEYQSFIRPVRNPTLTSFCKELTSISQEMVSSAREFDEVIAEFRNWIISFKTPIFCSWGNYDKNQLKQDCGFHGVEYPFSEEHINIKQKFANNVGLRKGVGLGKALHKVNLKFLGTAHRGIDDARNMAKLSEHIFIESSMHKNRIA